MSDTKEAGRSVGLIGGGALALVGVWLLLRGMGLLPDQLFDLWGRLAWPVAVIVVGIGLVIMASRGGTAFRGPQAGARLHKSRSDKWVDGVLGGLGHYLGLDPVLLRLAFIVLMLAGWGSLILAYIVMAIIVPREPEVQPSRPVA